LLIKNKFGQKEIVANEEWIRSNKTIVNPKEIVANEEWTRSNKNNYGSEKNNKQ
jgi:hypothetical protein